MLSCGALADAETKFTTDNMLALVFNLFLVYLVVEVRRVGIRDGFSCTFLQSDLTTLVVLLPPFTVQIVLVVRWLVYWVIVAELMTFAVTGKIDSIVWLDKDVSDSDRETRRNILIALFVAEVVTIVFHIVTHYLYPWVVRKRYLNAKRWWNVVPSKRHCALTYRSIARFYKRKRVKVSYCGGLDSQGQPHGFGIWSDSSFHGENLHGQWEHGVPVGPFQSQESGSGYCFVNLRIAFCHNRAETRNDQVLYIPKHSVDGLHWGVARYEGRWRVVVCIVSVLTRVLCCTCSSIECSVSGGFFSFLPQVHHLTDGVVMQPPQSASECLPHLRTPLDDIHTFDETSATRSFSFREGERYSSSRHIGQVRLGCGCPATTEK